MNEQYRHEMKFLISKSEKIVLRNRIAPILQADKNATDDNQYHVRSLYFDDIKNTDYFSKLSGFEKRKKYRIRMYNHDDQFIRLEKKIKVKDVSRKEQTIITREIAQDMIKGKFTFDSDENDEILEGIKQYHKKNILRPSVITDYIREAYIFAPGNVRITFDSELKTNLLSGDFFDEHVPLVPAIGHHQVILEVKYDQFLPDIIRMLLAGLNGMEMALSKFALCKKFITLNDWEVQ